MRNSLLLTAFSTVPTRFGVGANRNKGADSIGAQQSQMSKVARRTGNVALKNPVLRCPWWYVTSSNVETNVGNDGSIRASIEYPAGVFRQATVGGSITLTATDGTSLDFDPITGLTIPPNTTFWVHCRADGGTGGKFPQNAYISTARFGDGLDLGVSTLVTDKTLVGGEGTANAGGQRAYTPFVLGTVAKTVRDTIALGDSILNGDTEDAGTTGGDAYGNFGPFERLFGLNSINYINLGRTATKAQNWQTAGATTKRLDVIRGIVARSLLNQLSHNDWAETLVTWKGYMGIVNALFAPFAGKVVCSTTTPYTDSSTDAYTTTAGQTKHPSSNLPSFDTAVRAGTVTGQTGGYLDLNIIMADSTDPSLWRNPGSSVNPTAAAITSDGTHSLVLGAQLGAAGMDASPLL